MSHRSIVHWNQWLNKSLGHLVMQTERQLVESFLAGKYGKYALLIGVPHQTDLLQNLDLPCHLLLTPLTVHPQVNLKSIESNLYELPIASGSVDAVILPHTLELVDNPRQLLAEACRIVRPEGHLIICGFNPFSLWGLNKRLRPQKHQLPQLHSLHQGTLIKWLNLSDFELLKQSNVLYSPPLENEAVLKRLEFMEWLGNKCHLPWGAVYVLMAQAKVLPLTPIRLRWQQSLAGLGVPSSIPGPTIRNSQ